MEIKNKLEEYIIECFRGVMSFNLGGLKIEISDNLTVEATRTEDGVIIEIKGCVNAVYSFFSAEGCREDKLPNQCRS